MGGAGSGRPPQPGGRNWYCEDCVGPKKKQPTWGIAAGGRRIWCTGCAKSHEGAVKVAKMGRPTFAKKCEDCMQEVATFRPAGSGKRRWCGDCALSHEGASQRGNIRRGPYCHFALQFSVPTWMLHMNENGARKNDRAALV